MRANAATVTDGEGLGAAGDDDVGAEPSRMRRTPSPIALVPAAQAVETQNAGPVQPKRIEITPAVALGIIIGTKNGLTRDGPRSKKTWQFSSRVVRPPTPVAAITAQRAGSAPSSPASSIASAAAPNPRWVTRSWRRTSFGPKYSTGS